MKRYFVLIPVLLLLLFSACVPETEISENASAPAESTPEEEASVSVKDPLATEEWESATKENGDSVLRKYTKEYNGDEENYTLTAMKYTNGEFTEKIITVYTDGKKTHDETYKYDGDTLLLCRKCDYDPETSDPVYYDTYEVDQYDSGYAYYESKLHLSVGGAITDGNRTYYTEDGSVLKTEEVSQREMKGYACTYTVTTFYENGAVSGFTHTAEDRNMDYWYVEKRTADGETLYTREKLNGAITVTFPDVGAYSVAGTEYEFFDADGNLFAKARLENLMLNIYEIAEGVSTQDAVDAANAIITKAHEYGL